MDPILGGIDYGLRPDIRGRLYLSWDEEPPRIGPFLFFPFHSFLYEKKKKKSHRDEIRPGVPQIILPRLCSSLLHPRGPHVKRDRGDRDEHVLSCGQLVPAIK